jgi:hypothetical protein
LQHDPIDEATGSQNMLGALILYQALVTGADTCALQWAEFQDGLSRALQYINTRGAYHQWRHEQKIASLRCPKPNSASEQRAQEEMEKDPGGVETDDPAAEPPRTTGSLNTDEYTGGIIRPSGSGVFVRPGTSLARLKDQLGDKFALLGNIPPLPMTISPHDLGPSYFPFRMHIGSDQYTSGEHVEIFAYLVHDGVKNAVMKFRSHSTTGHEQSWTMEQLEEATLFEPFEYLNNLKSKSSGAKPGSSTRAAKIRSIVSYYFFLAENEGLIGDPRVTIGDAFGKRFCAACAELQESNLGEDCSVLVRGGDHGNFDGVDTIGTNIHVYDVMVTSGEHHDSDTRLREKDADLNSRRSPLAFKIPVRRRPIRQPLGSCKSCFRRHQKYDRTLSALGCCKKPGSSCDYPRISDIAMDDNSMDETVGNHEDDAGIDVSIHALSEPVNPNEEPKEKLTREEDSDRRLSGMVTLELQSKILAHVVEINPLGCRDGPSGTQAAQYQQHQHQNQHQNEFVKLSREKAPGRRSPTDEIDTISSSLVTRGSSKPLEIDSSVLVHKEVLRENDNEMETATSSAHEEEQLRDPEAAMNSKPANPEVEPREAVSRPESAAVKKERTAKLLDIVGAAAGEYSTPFDKGSVRGSLVTDADKADLQQAADERSQRKQINSAEDKNDSESIPMDMSSSSSPVQNVKQSSRTQASASRASSTPHRSSSGSYVNILAALVFDNKPPTPEPSAERELKAPPAVNATDILLNLDETIELYSDNEADIAPLALKNEVERTPKVNHQPRNKIDLTQLSSSPQDKKRKPTSILKFDSDDNIIEEVDDGGWRRASRSRRK